MRRAVAIHRAPQLISDETYQMPSGTPGFRRALLLNPVVYDAQYWARWSQPAGLLRIGTLMKEKGYHVDLIDCMETDAKGHVRKSRRMDGSVQQSVEVDDIRKLIWHFGKPWDEVERLMRALPEAPDEVWITSVMTYWWQSTRDAVALVRRVFPQAEIYVGGIYPTLAPEHAREMLDADYIFQGELEEASNKWTALELYETKPTYAILTTTRGCPWDCVYCAARTLNGGKPTMRWRSTDDVLAEIEDKMERFGIRHFGFYEDNALIVKGHLKRILEEIIARGHKLELYAPEGFETRLLTYDLLETMRRAGFRKIHLPFETLKWDTNVSWNRRHASTASFDAALNAAIEAGFKPRTEEINAFVLFGLPGEDLQDVVDSATYVHHHVGSIIPMLFTPVPGTHIYREHQQYLEETLDLDLHQLNGKFLPFLPYNQERHPGLHASHYLQLEALMTVINNGKFMSRTVNLCEDSPVGRAFRETVASGSL